MEISKQLYNCIYLSTEEFLLLLGKAGVQRIAGVFPGRVQEITGEQISEAYFSLYARGLMWEESDEKGPYFRPQPLLASMIRHIRDASETVMACEEEDNGDTLLCYMGEYVVVAEVSPADEGAIRLFELPRESFDPWLKQTGHRLLQA